MLVVNAMAYASDDAHLHSIPENGEEDPTPHEITAQPAPEGIIAATRFGPAFLPGKVNEEEYARKQEERQRQRGRTVDTADQ